MDPFDVPVMALRDGDQMKVGMERYDRIHEIDHSEPGTVKVAVSSGIIYTFGYRDTVTIASNHTRRRSASHRLGCVR